MFLIKTIGLFYVKAIRMKNCYKNKLKSFNIYTKLISLIFLLLVFPFMLLGCFDGIHSAAKKGDVEAVKKYISKGGDVNALNRDGIPILSMAIKSGNINIVEILLDAGADITLQDTFIGTPLHVAASVGKTDIIELLLDHGADINALSERSNETPIGEAVRGRHSNAVKMLLDRGADPNVIWDDGSSILHMAASMGEEEIVNILIDANVNIDACDKNMRTPLFSATSGFIMKKIGFKHKDIITLLVERGANLYHKDIDGNTPLEYAKKWKLEEAIKILERLQEKYPSQTMEIGDKGAVEEK